jgi:hypothetical protein
MADAVATVSAPASRPRRSLWLRWVTVTTAGELAGFCVPAVTAASAVSAGLGDPAVLALVVTAGAAEGALLGWAQATVLRDVIPGLRVGWWVRATAAGAVVAYVLGMLPGTVRPYLSDVPLPLLVAAAVPAGLALLASVDPAAGRWSRDG